MHNIFTLKKSLCLIIALVMPTMNLQACDPEEQEYALSLATLEKGLTLYAFQYLDALSLINIEKTCTALYELSRQHDVQIWKHCIPERVLPFYSPAIINSRPDGYFKSWRIAALLVNYISHSITNAFTIEDNRDRPTFDKAHLSLTPEVLFNHLKEALSDNSPLALLTFNVFLDISNEQSENNKIFQLYSALNQYTYFVHLAHNGNSRYNYIPYPENEALKLINDLYLEVFKTRNNVYDEEFYQIIYEELSKLLDHDNPTISENATDLLARVWVTLHMFEKQCQENDKFVELYQTRREIVFLNALDTHNMYVIMEKLYEQCPDTHHQYYSTQLTHALQGSITAQHSLFNISVNLHDYFCSRQDQDNVILVDYYFAILNFILKSR